jgi:16S rRNA G966 N2-methylase RsmD
MNASIYARPEKPTFKKVMQNDNYIETKKTEYSLITVDKDTECHVTPPAVVKDMISFTTITNKRILEPSAGTGNILKELQKIGGYRSIDAIEKHCTLYNNLVQNFKGVGIVRSCFLEYEKETQVAKKEHKNLNLYDLVLMNPPFKTYKKHLESAQKMLNKGGEIVAVVPASCNMPGFKTLQNLDSDTFYNCSVQSKIVMYKKSGLI